jgi:hypothetical protein
MTRKEAERLTRQSEVLQALGFTSEEAEQLRRISMTLQRWHELECGTGEGQVSRSVERENEDGTGRPLMRVQYPTANGYHDSRSPIPDRETGAKKRLDAILARVNVQRAGKVGRLSAYIQTDPRGAALYILRPGDVPEGADVGSYYNRGICVY